MWIIDLNATLNSKDAVENRERVREHKKKYAENNVEKLQEVSKEVYKEDK